LQDWVNTGPWAPDGEWYKDFGSFVICGSGEFPKTVVWNPNRIVAVEEQNSASSIFAFRPLRRLGGSERRAKAIMKPSRRAPGEYV
jgi:hypothetical protein